MKWIGCKANNVRPSVLILGKQFTGCSVENRLGIASGLGGVGGAVPLWAKGVQQGKVSEKMHGSCEG